jgi:hypothetical protein
VSEHAEPSNDPVTVNTREAIKFIREIIEPKTITDTSHPQIQKNLVAVLRHLQRLKRIEDQARLELQKSKRRMQEIFPPLYREPEDAP